MTANRIINNNRNNRGREGTSVRRGNEELMERIFLGPQIVKTIFAVGSNEFCDHRQYLCTMCISHYFLRTVFLRRVKRKIELQLHTRKKNDLCKKARVSDDKPAHVRCIAMFFSLDIRWSMHRRVSNGVRAQI